MSGRDILGLDLLGPIGDITLRDSLRLITFIVILVYLCIIIIAMLSSTAAMAQSVSPQASTTNSIYIEQVGDNSNINIVQKGQNNRIGSEENRLILNGNGQIINTTQEVAPASISSSSNFISMSIFKNVSFNALSYSEF